MSVLSTREPRNHPASQINGGLANVIFTFFLYLRRFELRTGRTGRDLG